MELTEPREPIVVTDSELNGSSFGGVSISHCDISGPRIDGSLVSDLIAAYRKSV